MPFEKRGFGRLTPKKIPFFLTEYGECGTFHQTQPLGGEDPMRL